MTTRRAFLATLTGWIAAAIGAILAVPALGYLVGPALRRKADLMLEVGSIADLLPDRPAQREVVAEMKNGWMTGRTTRGIWVTKLSSGELRVFNPHCTHLGCAFRWDDAQRRFRCPCHGGVYDLDGNVVAGPPPRPLDTLDYTLDGDQLQVKYEDFRIGTHKKIRL